jgi:hypothetical protein
MKAELLVRERLELGDGAFAEFVLWHVPEPVRGCAHSYKYRLALVENDVCILRYDNEAGKGDHRHIGGHETPYVFTTAERLFADFLADIHSRRRT